MPCLDPDRLLERLLEELRPYEFRTIVLGFERPLAYDRASHEAAYRELKVALGREIERRLPGVEVDFLHPEVRVEVDSAGGVRVLPSPLFVGGRYRKHSRAMPASRWRHHACKGEGCPACAHTGALFETSVEDLLAEPALELSGGERALFHALGREDTDARMLGSGRPFVLEIRRPLRRGFSLEELGRRFGARAQGAAEVFGLARTDRSSVPALKAARAEKTYRAWIRVSGELPAEAPALVAALAGTKVEQLSPRRVMHRRGRGALRVRRIAESLWLGQVEGRCVWQVRVEAGTYVKELVSGDEGRTRPSLSSVLGVPSTCEALDVLEIHWDPPWEGGGEAP